MKKNIAMNEHSHMAMDINTTKRPVSKKTYEKNDDIQNKTQIIIQILNIFRNLVSVCCKYSMWRALTFVGKRLIVFLEPAEDSKSPTLMYT